MDRARRQVLKASLAAGLAASAPAFAAGRFERTSARTRSGRVLGARDGDLHVFRGIRYGADTAAHRFQPPQREAPWRGARDALAFGADRQALVHGAVVGGIRPVSGNVDLHRAVDTGVHGGHVHVDHVC